MPAVALPKGTLYNDKYNIPDPAQVNFVPRTDFLQSLTGTHEYDVALEDIILSLPQPRDSVAVDLRHAAQYYVYFRDKGARLPKFSKWIMGMFASNKTFATLVAEAGQQAAARSITISTDIVDILRCADTDHFFSCFKWGDENYTHTGYGEIPTRICEETPGIAIAYIDDDKGKMLGRVWLHHATADDTGEDVVVCTPYNVSNALKSEVVARLLKEQFKIRAGIGGDGRYDRGVGAVPIKYVGCFTKSVHHDLATWAEQPVATL